MTKFYNKEEIDINTIASIGDIFTNRLSYNNLKYVVIKVSYFTTGEVGGVYCYGEDYGYGLVYINQHNLFKIFYRGKYLLTEKTYKCFEKKVYV